MASSLRPQGTCVTHDDVRATRQITAQQVVAKTCLRKQP